MVTSAARIETDRPERYLEQICRHAAATGSGGHAARMHGGDHPGVSDLDVRAEWSGTQGTVSFSPWGSCALTADDAALTLRVEAVDAEGLQRIQEILASDLDRFGRRDGLAVRWDDPNAS